MPEAKDFYDAVASDYGQQYERDNLYKLPSYPSNYFRLQLLVNSFVRKGVKRVLEVGIGEGTPLVNISKLGIEVHGFDISQKMVQTAKARFTENGLDPDRVTWGDIQDCLTYARVLKDGPFDGVIAMGVMPHVGKDHLALSNISTCVKPEGTVFIEFRNKLFSLFTFNRYTYEFIMDDLLAGVNPDVREAVSDEIKPRLQMDLPPQREAPLPGAPGYDAILSKFHNPLDVHNLFRDCGFKNLEFLWYHYHPAMPMLESKLGRLFREESVALEHEHSGWRGLFLCSAFVVQATRE